jgi:hypothetical protein
MTMQSDILASPIGDPNDPTTSAALKRCFAYGNGRNQGLGFREITGYGYPIPEPAIHPVTIVDDNGIQRVLVLNALDGKIHDISTRVGPLNSGLYPARRDSEGLAVAISGITLSGTSVVVIATSTAHGYSTGDIVVFRNIVGTVELNNNYYTVTYIGANSFSLQGTNSSLFTAYTSGGYVFLAGVLAAPDLELGEDVASSESALLRIQKMQVSVRPLDESTIGQPGYDANGYPLGLKLNAKAFKDGQTTETTSADGIGVPVSRITYDRVIEANRIKTEIGANMGEFAITEIQKDYISTDIPAGPDTLITTEQGYQEEFALPQLWIGSVEGNILNRVLGGVISIVGASSAAGPDGASNSAMAFSAPITLPGALSLTGAGTLLVWYYGTIAVTIGGVSVALTDLIATAVNGWKLGYAASLTQSGILVITPTGSARVADIRAFDAIVSANALAYYYNNIINNSGDIFL